MIKTKVWYLCRCKNLSYIKSADGIFLHRFILEAEKGYDVDHIDGNGLNCSRSNMRIVTRSQNNMNQKSRRAGRKGIYYDRHSGKWRAEIIFDGKKIRSKRVSTELEAIQIREQYEKKYHGEYSGFGTER